MQGDYLLMVSFSLCNKLVLKWLSTFVIKMFRFAQERKKQLEEEAKVMKDVPGWVVGKNVYNSGRWMPPSNGKLEAQY